MSSIEEVAAYAGVSVGNGHRHRQVLVQPKRVVRKSSRSARSAP